MATELDLLAMHKWQRSVRHDMPNGVRVQLLGVGKDTISIGLEVEV